MRYGVGYKGSKSRIAKDIIDILPSGKRFIDLFGGGGAMSHCAALSGKYDKIIYSDIDPSISELCKNLFAGKYYNRTDIFEWVSRDRFLKEKENNPVIRWMWSFSNNGKDYMYSKILEPQKEAVHKAIVNKEYSDLFLEITKGVIPFKSETIADRKREWSKFSNKHRIIQSLINLRNLCRVEALTRIEALTRSYKDYMYAWGGADVVYCDIPYQSTNCGSYDGFNHDEFWEWARNIPCYISEYSAPNDFECIWEKQVCVLSTSDGNGRKTTERLFMSPACKDFEERIQQPKQLTLGF